MPDLPDRLSAALADRYRIEREVGQGGMATVYLAHDIKHNRKVALKVLRPDLAHAIGPERFLNEIETTANLRHPHILPLYDSGRAVGRVDGLTAGDVDAAAEQPAAKPSNRQAEEFLYYVMPFVEGESLRDRLNRERQLPLDEALRIAREVADALSYAHSRGVIHRDIKPENILLEHGHAVVADFGIARAVDAAGGDRLTETGMAIGTPTYMSPEQAAGERDLDGRSDQYALGCVLHEMLAGQPPFTGPTVESVIHQHLTVAPPPVTQLRPGVPAEIAGALQRALAKTPADRFNAVAQFADALGAASRHASDIVAPPVRRRPPQRRAILAVAGAALLLGVFGWWMTHRGESSPLADDLIAVAPFDVLDAGLSLWSEGMVDVLARNLDGAGPLRTVPPTYVIRHWAGRADRASATALGRATGARLTVFGQILATQGDSVRATATLFDVAAGRPLGEIEVRDRSASMDRVADSLTIGVLRALGRSRPVRAVRATAFQSTSLPALKAFLRGEQLFRRTVFDSARAAYQQAVEADSTLALAWRRMATTQGWLSDPNDPLVEVYALRAAALNRGLAPRDSLLISADSLSIVLYTASRDTMFRAHRARLFATLETVVQRYPDDPEAWHELGDARFHFQVPGQTDPERIQSQFDRAIALDSAFGESYIHAVWLALGAGKEERAHRYITAYLDWNRRPDDAHARAYAVLDRLLASRLAQPGALDHAIADLGDRDLRVLFLATSLWPDTGEVAVQVARAGRSAALPGTPWPTFLTQALAYRGHLEAAYAAAGGAVDLVAQLAPLGGVPAEAARSIYHTWLQDPPLTEEPSPAPQGFNTTLFSALPWWAEQRDTTSLARFGAVLERAEPRAVMDVRPWLRYGRAAAAAYLSLARADTSRAVEQFRALPDTICPCPYDRITAAQLFLNHGLAQEAHRKFAGQSPGFMSPTEGFWRLARGRTFESVGERDSAMADYGFVVQLWQRADSALQPYVSEAKSALIRLTAEAAR